MSVRHAQNIEEIHLFLQARGLRQRSHAMVMAGGELVARYACVDSAGAEQVHDFTPVDRSIFDGPPTRPSGLLDAGQWLAISDRFAGDQSPDLPLAARALEQVLMFCPPDGDLPAEALFSDEGRAYARTQPAGTFRRSRLQARLEVYERLQREQPAVAAQRPLIPLLKAPDFAHRDHCVHMSLPGLPPRADLPTVTFAENTPNGYVLLTKGDAPGVDPLALLAPALDRLLAGPQRDLQLLQEEIAVSAGRDLSAELLLHERFLRDVVGPALKSQEFWVCVPHRVAFYALRAGAAPGNVQLFVGMVEADRARAPGLGHALVSDRAFLIRQGRIVDAVPLEALRNGATPAAAGRSAVPAPRAPGRRINWLAGIMGLFFGGVVGMGVGVGIIASQNISGDLAGVIVLGCASILGAGGAALGGRSSLR